MSNLTIRDVYKSTVPEQIKSKLKVSEELVIATSIPSEVNPLVKDLDGDQMEVLITGIGKKVALMTGHKANDEDEQEEVNREVNRQVLKFKFLTAGEIMRALENGLEGQYTPKGSFVYFTPSNFVQWVRAYEEQKQKVKKVYRELEAGLPTPAHEPSEFDKLTLSWNFFTWVIQKYLNERSYEDGGNVVYQFLTKIEFLNLTEQEWNKAVGITNAKLLAELKDNPREKQKAIKRIRESHRFSDDGLDSKVLQTVISERLEEFYNLSHEEKFDYMEAVLEKVHLAQQNLEHNNV